MTLLYNASLLCRGASPLTRDQPTYINVSHGFPIWCLFELVVLSIQVDTGYQSIHTHPSRQIYRSIGVNSFQTWIISHLFFIPPTTLALYLEFKFFPYIHLLPANDKHGWSMLTISVELSFFFSWPHSPTHHRQGSFVGRLDVRTPKIKSPPQRSIILRRTGWFGAKENGVTDLNRI